MDPLVKAVLDRWKMWQDLYSEWYIERHFWMSHEETKALITFVEEHK